jgi:hypothetical protein
MGLLTARRVIFLLTSVVETRIIGVIDTARFFRRSYRLQRILKYNEFFNDPG